MAFKVQLDEFNGPLDLMLYLIKENKLDLFDLNISELADQYIAYIDQAKEQKLEIASEYLSELAGLIEFKSRRLLPRDRSELDAKDYEEDEQNLVYRLLEYKRFKEVSARLEKRYELRIQELDRPLDKPLFKSIEEDLEKEIEYEENIYDLIDAMEKVIERYHLAHPQDRTIQQKELSVEDVIFDVRKFFFDGEKHSMEEVLMASPSFQHLIVRFLAILDLLRMQELKMLKSEEGIILKGAF